MPFIIVLPNLIYQKGKAIPSVHLMRDREISYNIKRFLSYQLKFLCILTVIYSIYSGREKLTFKCRAFETKFSRKR